MSLTQESILSFLLERGGKARNSELLNTFRSQIDGSDPAEKQHNRDLFKKLVNSVAVVKQLDEAKFVVVKKRYQDFVREQTDDSFSSRNTSCSCTPPRRVDDDDTDCPLNANCNYYGDAKHVSARSVQQRSTSSVDTATVKVLNISADHASRAGKSGPVFAVIAVKSPPRGPAPAAQGGFGPQVHRHETSHKTITFSTEASAASVQTPTSHFPACESEALSEHQCSKSRPTEDMLPPGFPLVRPQSKATRQADDAKYTESVPLEPVAHEWLVKCAAGLWGQIHALLLRDTRLAQKKDFMSGFTALHWAAKDGNSEMIHKLMDVSRKRGTYINVNSKTHGGYTPLHVAAIHGHTEVMVLLVQGFGASVNERDNAGKKAFRYLGEGVSAEVKALLGGLQQSKYRERTEDEDDYREHTKGFNTISKLFQPHIGKKHKTTTKFVHDW
ncbi:putative ankyrin repeat domain-containing protein SOWAHA [Scophthalmus maximus]|nr:putative ankyrin repeat domain-containing protein SOWAHA [Scophthalmus maximus]